MRSQKNGSALQVEPTMGDSRGTRATKTPRVLMVTTDQLIENPLNVRERDYESEESWGEFVKSVSEGIRVPLKVKPAGVREIINEWGVPEQREVYMLIAGHRRTRAARLAQEQMPVLEGRQARIPIPVMLASEIEARKDDEAIVNQYFDNNTGLPLTDLELGKSFAMLTEDYGWTKAQIAEKYGKPEEWVSERLLLHQRSPKPLREAFYRGRIKFTTALVFTGKDLSTADMVKVFRRADEIAFEEGKPKYLAKLRDRHERNQKQAFKKAQEAARARYEERLSAMTLEQKAEYSKTHTFEEALAEAGYRPSEFREPRLTPETTQYTIKGKHIRQAMAELGFASPPAAGAAAPTQPRGKAPRQPYVQMLLEKVDRRAPKAVRSVLDILGKLEADEIALPEAVDMINSIR